MALTTLHNNLHKHYTGIAIEFKNPKENSALSGDQSKMLWQYQNNVFKTLVSNDYDFIIEQSIEYFRDVRIKCSYCSRKFISSLSIKNHITRFHKKIKKDIVLYIYMNNHKVGKEKARPFFYKTEEERKDAIRRSKTRYMLSKIWYCEVCDREYCLAGKTKDLKTVNHNNNFLNRPLELDH